MSRIRLGLRMLRNRLVGSMQRPETSSVGVPACWRPPGLDEAGKLKLCRDVISRAEDELEICWPHATLRGFDDASVFHCPLSFHCDIKRCQEAVKPLEHQIDYLSQHDHLAELRYHSLVGGHMQVFHIYGCEKGTYPFVMPFDAKSLLSSI